MSIVKNIVKWQKTFVSKNNDLEIFFDEKYKDVLKNQFWSYKFALESWFKWKRSRKL